MRCGAMTPRADLDRILWCDECRLTVHARATRKSWRAGLVVATALALWIWLYIEPSNLVIGGWIGTVLAAFYVAARVTREVLYTMARLGKRDLAEPVPPEQDPH